MNLTLGIDPGSASGAVAVLSENEEYIDFFDIKNNPFELILFLTNITANLDYEIKICNLEKVSAFPGQGSVSGFNFGVGYGIIQSALISLKIPYNIINPKDWQANLEGLPSKKAGVTKEQRRKQLKQAIYEWAKRRFPRAELRSFNKDTNRADALGLAFYSHGR